MKIAICEDDMIYQRALKEAVAQWKVGQKLTTLAVDCYLSTEELLHGITMRKMDYDLIFLDIEFRHEMNGIECARQIRTIDSRVPIVFVTNYSEYATQGYKVNALRYICKPVVPQLIAECLDIAYRQWQFLQKDTVVIADGRKRSVLSMRKILFAESQAHHIVLHLADGMELVFRLRLMRLEAMLPSGLLVRCHKSYIANLFYVTQLTKDCILLASGQTLPLGRKYRESVETAFDSYYQGCRV